ncbi:DUF2800 domain-containing protein [candidate division KSB1 bacterium]|nr:DUF2800 domain-containing protein [candidate division KSB1 bacterium]
MTNHAKLSPSSSNIWIKCPGAGAIPVPVAPPPNIHMLQGTSAHTMLEKAIENDIDPMTWSRVPVIDGKKRIRVNVTDDMKKSVATALEEFEKILDSCSLPVYYIEHLLVMKQIHKSIYGTADIVIDDKKALWVLDFKNGAGFEVDAEKNSQLALYGLGALREFGRKDRPLHLGIIQPRAKSGNIVKIWTIEDIDAFETAWVKRVKQAKKNIDDFSILPPGQRYLAGDHCRWCAVKTVCPRILEQSIMSIVSEPEKQIKLRLDYLIEIFQHKQQILDNLKVAESAAYERVLKGGKVPGFKLVNAQSKRQWLDTDKVESALEKLGHKPYEYMKESLKGLADIEKLAGKEFVDKHTIKASTKTILVYESDKRPEVQETSKDDFEEIEE